MGCDDDRINNPMYTITRVDDGSGSAQRCPVCNGTGFVDAGFYNFSGAAPTSSAGTEMCRACNGVGYVVV